MFTNGNGYCRSLTLFFMVYLQLIPRSFQRNTPNPALIALSIFLLGLHRSP